MGADFTVTLLNGRKTDVYFLSTIKELSAKLSAYGRRVLWVFDSNSAALFTNLPANSVILPSGEKNKTFSSIEKIISAALDAHLSRDSVFIGFGGGVVCDMTAFAASVFMRGCSLILVPTTLLCMVDASIGGKSAIDFKGGKNLIGTFYPAKDVLISSACLRTLPQQEFISGMGEVIKHAFLTEDDALYDFLVKNRNAILKKDRETVSEMVDMSLRVKASYIERDPEEKLGIRQALNLGHTFAHALETLHSSTPFEDEESLAAFTVRVGKNGEPNLPVDAFYARARAATREDCIFTGLALPQLVPAASEGALETPAPADAGETEEGDDPQGQAPRQ